MYTIMFWTVRGSCWVIMSLCWHCPTTSKQVPLLEALLYLQVQDKKVCQHPPTLPARVSSVHRRCSISLGQQRYLHNWLHLQLMEPCTNGPQEGEEINICKFQAEYSFSPQTSVELLLPSVVIKYVRLCCIKLNLGGTKKKTTEFFHFK